MTDNIFQLNPSFELEDVSQPADAAPLEHLVLVVHGIRDNSAWAHELHRSGPFEAINVRVRPVSYRYMTVLHLLSGAGRVERTRMVRERIAEAIKRNRGFDRLSIIFHSNGTKVASEIGNDTLEVFDCVFFMGSICHSDDVGRFDGCRRRVVNECGTRDWWPILAAMVRPDLYSPTGVVGFQNEPVMDRIFHYGHSHATQREHFEKHVVPVLLTGEARETEDRAPRYLLHLPNYLRVLSLLAIAAVVSAVI